MKTTKLVIILLLIGLMHSYGQNKGDKSETLDTPAGKFANVLLTIETTPLEPKDKSIKLYAPGIGLI